MKTIILVPLDSRPCCSIFPEKIGSIAGCRIIKPPDDMLGKFLTPGKCSCLKEWLMQHADYADGFVISCDMLSYGGLIASRDAATTYEEAVSRLEVIKELKSKYPAKPIHVQSILMRISITARNREYAAYWKDINEYSVLTDKIERLGMNELRDKLDNVKARIPDAVLSDYLFARERNHKVNLELINLVKHGFIDFLTITQEDCAAFGPHINEQKALMQSIFQNQVTENVIIYPGADEGTQTLIMRMILRSYGIRPKFYQIFSDSSGQGIIADFEDRPLGETLKCHIYAIGGLPVDYLNDADMVLMVNTPVFPEGPGASNGRFMYLNPRHNIWSFVDKINYYMNDRHMPVCLADTGFCNGSDTELVEYMLRRVGMLELFGYAGWNTCGNTIGTALSMACARLCMEKHGSPNQLQMFVEFMIERLLDEWAYQANVRADLYAYIDSELNISPMNLEDRYCEANSRLKELMSPYTDRMKQSFTGKTLCFGDSKYVIEGVDACCELPWDRAFECRTSAAVTLAPHRSL